MFGAVVLKIRLEILSSLRLFFIFNDTATTEIYTLSLHDALPICDNRRFDRARVRVPIADVVAHETAPRAGLVISPGRDGRDRKSTRLNSSHRTSSYAVFCLKKKKNDQTCRLTLP